MPLAPEQQRSAPEHVVTRVSLVLLLTDRVAREPRLLGNVLATIAGQAPPRRRLAEGLFAFFGLPAGTHQVRVRSADETPYYRPTTITVSLPPARATWPAFPDLSLADRAKPLDSPDQPIGYRLQRTRAALLPTPRYPFPPEATLVRGTVLRGLTPVAGAAVTASANAAAATETDAAGEFVLFVDRPPASGGPINVTATPPASPPRTVTVPVRRHSTVVVPITLP
jgi:hypothetical protein